MINKDETLDLSVTGPNEETRPEPSPTPETMLEPGISKEFRFKTIPAAEEVKFEVPILSEPV